MKISQQPTDHLLVRANCQSQWDCCDFAVVVLGEPWKETMRKRLATAESFFTDYDFKHFAYHDGSADFYISKEDEAETLFGELQDKEWTFVTLEEEEEESFGRPESRLDSYSLVLYKDGSGFYKAYGKHTGEEFYTAELPLAEIMKSMQSPSCGDDNMKAGEIQ